MNNYLNPPHRTMRNDITSKIYVLAEWKKRTLMATIIGCLSMTLTRKNLMCALHSLMSSNQGHFTKSDAGVLTTTASLSIAASRLAAGHILAKYSSRTILSLALISSGAVTLLFAMVAPQLMPLLTLLWAVNGLAQGITWPCATSLLYQWFDENERGTYWAIAAMTDTIGSAILVLVGSFITAQFGWKSVFVIPGLVCILASIVVSNNTISSPKRPINALSGSPTVARFKRRIVTSERSNFIDLLSNKVVLLLSCSDLLVCVIRAAIADWTVLLLTEAKQMSPVEAGACYVWFIIGGAAGTFICGHLSDTYFKGNRMHVIFLFFVILLTSVSSMWALAEYSSRILNSIVLFVVGFALHGPHFMLGLIAMEAIGEQNGGTANALVGAFGLVGASMAGAPLSVLVRQSWNSLYIICWLCAIIALLLQLPLAQWSAASTKKRV